MTIQADNLANTATDKAAEYLAIFTDMVRRRRKHPRRCFLLMTKK